MYVCMYVCPVAVYTCTNVSWSMITVAYLPLHNYLIYVGYGLTYLTGYVSSYLFVVVVVSDCQVWAG